MIISMIVAVGKNREIGFNNKLLWNIPEDMKRFREITAGHVVIMGSKTYESIGRPLPNRINIVIAINGNYNAPGCFLVTSIEEALKIAKEKEEMGEIFIIGGGSIYEQFLSKACKLYITVIDDSSMADVFFPEYFEFKNIIYKKESEHHGLKYTFFELTR